MAFQDIVALLRSEGEETSEKLLAEVKEKKELLLQEAKEVEKDFIAKAALKREEKKHSVLKNTQTFVLHQNRALKSKMEQLVLESVFDTLKEKIEKASDQELVDIFAPLFESISEEAGEVVVLGKTPASVVKKAIKQAGKKFTIASDVEESGFGFLFNGDGFSMDFSIDSIIRSGIRPKYEAEIFKKLFS